ncbi:hypothetical protein DFH11DRAFT_1686070 [Phellopilus nigrolimitatus]|nr:hypothetical protein DFH11DRAFT_1686070 [Phellopilus nigrolimitatus]
MQNAYPPLRPVEPRPPILPSQTSSDNYRLPSSSSLPSIASAEAGPSNHAPSANTKRRVGVANAKKRRANAMEDGEDGVPRQPTKQRESPKKKKAARACFLCQKAHLTCDDTRPCQRCVKRGMAEKCTEGHRKKAKYLLEEGELEALKKGKSVEQSTPEGSQPPLPTQPSVEQFPTNDLYFNLPMDQAYSFGSEAANLEYSSLSAILGLNNYSPDQSFLTSETPPSSSAASYGQTFASAGWPAEPQQQPNIAPQALMGGQPVGYEPSYPGSQQQQENGVQYGQNGQYGGQSLYDGSASNISIQQNGHEQQHLSVQRMPSEEPYATELAYQNQQTFVQPSPPIAPPMQPQPRIASTQSVSSIPGRSSNTTVASFVSPPASNSPMSSASQTDSGSTPIIPQGHATQNVYMTVKKPYSYIESYDFLMKFLYKRFNKNDILRVIRALAIYRPDFIFMEKCLRRSLIELEKLISYSGTPTVVWRRTGEICLVGILVTGRKYIYELFESQSVIEYWEKFASHAFENTTQSVFSHCVLLKPSGEPIPCTFCFSIRRDIFDLPSVVIGVFLSFFCAQS